MKARMELSGWIPGLKGNMHDPGDNRTLLAKAAPKAKGRQRSG
jgi:hypothetical protein